VLGPGGIAVVAMRGATNISRFLDLLGPAGIGVRIGGRCDAGQEDYFRNALERAGFGLSMSRADREALGFCVCTRRKSHYARVLIGALDLTRVPRPLDLVLAQA
jgi:hypothetical protein